MSQHNQHQSSQEADPNRLEAGTKWLRLSEHLVERIQQVGRSLRQVDPHLGYQEAQAKLLRTLEELKTLEHVQQVYKLIFAI